MNTHGLKLKHKNIIRLLKELYDKKLELSRKLDNLNAKIYRLEQAKNDCGGRIKDGRKK